MLDEPTASLTDDEIGRLHAVIGRLTASDVAIVYVSHRLKEIVEITNASSSCATGGSRWSARRADLDERSLVAAIVGEAASGHLQGERERPRTRFEGGAVLLRARGDRQRDRPDCRSARPRRRDPRPRRADRRGPHRDRPHARRRASRSVAARSSSTAATSACDPRGRHARPVSCFCPRIAGTRRSSSTSLSARTSRWRPLERFRGPFPLTPSRSKERAATASLVERLQIQTSGTETQVVDTVGREPTESRPGPMARSSGQGDDLRRAHRGHRCPSQGGVLHPDGGPGRRRHGDSPHLLRLL